MIYKLTTAVDAALRAKSFPVRAVYGPERTTRAAPTDTTIIIERDRDTADVFDTVLGIQENSGTNTPGGRRRATRYVGAKAHVWAKSNVIGARANEHEALCDILVDALYCAIDTYQQATIRIMKFTPSEGRLLKPEEIQALGCETWPGVVYRMRWRMPRGVYAFDWAGLGLPEAGFNGTTGEVEIRRNADDPPETVEM